MILVSTLAFLAVPLSIVLAEEPASDGAVQCGTRLLAQFPHEFPLPQINVAKPTMLTEAHQNLPLIEVGTQLPFVVAGAGNLVDATCQFVGDNVFVFVEDRQWDTNGGSILQSHVDDLGELFDSSTPADPSRGFYQLCTVAFGDAPDVDGYDPIFLLVLDIPDSRLVGFFDPRVAEHEVPELRRDILFVDALFVRREAYLARGTVAHELQHLIHWAHDDDEDTWIDEGLSGYAEELTGFPEADATVVDAFLRNPSAGLTDWKNRPHNYGSSYLFTSYLAERFGGDLIRAIVTEPRNGRDGINAAFAATGFSEDFQDAWSRWILANYASHDEAFSYRALGGRQVISFPVQRLPLANVGGFVEDQWGTITILLRTPGSVHVEFVGDATGRYRVWTYALRFEGADLMEVRLDDSGSGSAMVTDIDSVAVIVGKITPGGGNFEISARHVTPTAVARDEEMAEVSIDIGSGFPNPFNGVVTVPLGGVLLEGRELIVYNALGQRVRTLSLAPGVKHLVWDGRDDAGRTLASGCYRIVDTGHGVGKLAATSVTLVR